MSNLLVVTPRLMRALFITALQRYFLTHPQYPYNRDQTKTRIFIQDSYSEDVRRQNKVPAIIVDGGSIRFSEDSIGNNNAGYETHKAYLPKTEHQFLVLGDLAIHCICQNDIDAEELGFEVSMFLQSIRLEIMRMLHIQGITMPNLSKAQRIGKEGTSYTHDAIISIQYRLAYRVIHTPIDIGELLTSIDVVTGVDAPSVTPPNIAAVTKVRRKLENGTWDYGGDEDSPTGPEGQDHVDDGWVLLDMKLSKSGVIIDQDTQV